MDEKLRALLDQIIVLTGENMAYQMLCQALIATHPDREALLAAYVARASLADESALSTMADPTRAQEAFDRAHATILSEIRGTAT